MAEKKVINNDVINIGADFLPKKTKTVGELIAEGNLEDAESAIRNAGSMSRQDLSSSALLADVRAGETEQRQGRNPSMSLTKSNQFKNDPTSPLQLSEAFRARRGKEKGAANDDRRLNILADQFKVNTLMSMDARAGLIRKADLMTKGKTRDQKIQILSVLLKSSDDMIKSGTLTDDVLEQNVLMKEAINRKLMKLYK